MTSEVNMCEWVSLLKCVLLKMLYVYLFDPKMCKMKSCVRLNKQDIMCLLVSCRGVGG